jgi:hypothetical protein
MVITPAPNVKELMTHDTSCFQGPWGVEHRSQSLQGLTGDNRKLKGSKILLAPRCAFP